MDFEELYKWIENTQCLLNQDDKQFIESTCREYTQLGYNINEVIDTVCQFVYRHYKWKDALDLTKMSLIYSKVGEINNN